MPLSDASRGLIGAADLALMKPTAYLINTSRGPIVDEAALVEALRSRRIAGAGLDVYDVEPLPVDHPLRSLPNTLLLPHIGYVTTDQYRTWYGEVVEDIVTACNLGADEVVVDLNLQDCFTDTERMLDVAGEIHRLVVLATA